MALSRKNIFYSSNTALTLLILGAFVSLSGIVSNSASAEELISEDTAAACVAAKGTCPPSSGPYMNDGNCNRVATTPITYDIIGFCDAAQKKSCCKLKAAATGMGTTAPPAGTAGTPPAGTGSGTPPADVGTGTPPASQNIIEFKNPLAFNTVEEVLGSILGTLRGIIVILAIVFIIIGAVLYITSAGNEGQMTLAKGAITAAMIGLALGIAAPSFLKEIGNVLGWQGVNAGPAASALTLSEIARNVLNFLLSIVGILGIIMLVIGGIMYLTAAGDEDRIETGKKIVTYSIIGIVVALASLVIVSQIAAFFG